MTTSIPVNIDATVIQATMDSRGFLHELLTEKEPIFQPVRQHRAGGHP